MMMPNNTPANFEEMEEITVGKISFKCYYLGSQSTSWDPIIRRCGTSTLFKSCILMTRTAIKSSRKQRQEKLLVT